MNLKRTSAKTAARATRAVPGKRRVAAKASKGGLRRARSDARVQTLLHDDKVHARLRTALVNARVVYLRATRRGSAAEALLEDRRSRRALRRMLDALAEAVGSVRTAKQRQRRRRVAYVLPIVVAGGAGVLASNRDTRERVTALMSGSDDGSQPQSVYATGTAAS